MPVLIDLADDGVRAVLDRARAVGFMTYEQLGELLPAGEIQTTDLDDTEKALLDMGIELTDGLTEEERDLEVYDSISSWVAEGNMVPQLTGEAWASISRVSARREAAWRTKLSVPDGIDIPELPIPEDDEELLDEYIAFRDEKTALLEVRMSPDCPDGQEGAALDTRYTYVMNRAARLQCELRQRIREGRFRSSR